VVSRHAADEEVEQKSFVGVSGAIEHIQFVIRVCDNLLLVVFRFLILLKQFADAEFLEENAHVPDLVGEGALGVTVFALGNGLLSEPAHIVKQDLLVVPALVNVRNATMLDKRINRSPILADGLGIKTTGFTIGEIFFGCRCQRDPVSAAWQNGRTLRRCFPAEAVKFVERQSLLAFPLRFECIRAGVDPSAVVAHVVATFGMFF